MVNVAQVPKSVLMHMSQNLITFITFWRNLFSVSDGTFTLLQTGNFCHKWRRGRIQYIKHFSENKILLHHSKIEYSHMVDSYETVLYKASHQNDILSVKLFQKLNFQGFFIHPIDMFDMLQ